MLFRSVVVVTAPAKLREARRGGRTDERESRLLADREKVNIPGLVKFENKAPVDFVHSELTFQPGDATPWHYHPGPTLVTVKEGEITFTMGNCEARTYRANQSFVEGHPGMVGRAQNTGTTVARVYVVFITPVGSATTFPVSPVTCP